MPEGDTIHRLAREHTRDLGGKILRVSSPQGRFRDEAALLDGRRFRKAEAVGKHLFHFWAGGPVVHVHLGLYGWFYRHEGAAPDPRPTVRMRLSRPGLTLDLIGPPTCEIMSPEDRQALLARLGPDPLAANRKDLRVLRDALARRRLPIGAALLDQRLFAGVGNIYRAEALFRTRIHPLRPAASLSAREVERLWGTVRRLLERGLARGGPDPSVYGKDVCGRCRGNIATLRAAGRTLYFCPTCQPGAARAGGRAASPAKPSKRRRG